MNPFLESKAQTNDSLLKRRRAITIIGALVSRACQYATRLISPSRERSSAAITQRSSRFSTSSFDEVDSLRRCFRTSEHRAICPAARAKRTSIPQRIVVELVHRRFRLGEAVLALLFTSACDDVVYGRLSEIQTWNFCLIQPRYPTHPSRESRSYDQAGE
jgi:hypothetical protein